MKTTDVPLQHEEYPMEGTADSSTRKLLEETLELNPKEATDYILKDLEQGRVRIGRPSIYTKELADEVCQRIGLGESMRSVCRDEKMPAMSTIFKWLRDLPPFTEQYTRATEERTESHQELLLEIGDSAIEHAETADPKASGAVVQAYKIKGDNLKWSMSKMKPKKYGDKLDLTSGGDKLPAPIYGSQSARPSN